MSDIFDLLIEKLDRTGLPYEIIEHDEITNVDDGVALLNLSEENILKTIGFLANRSFVFVVLQGRKRIDYKKLTQILEIKRESLKMLKVDIIETELGYQLGGLSPIHTDNRINVLMDVNILKVNEVFCGIGVRNKTLRMTPKNLILASEAVLRDLIKEM